VFENKTLLNFSKQNHMERQILQNSAQYLQHGQRSTANTERGVLDRVQNLVEKCETPKAWHITVDIGGNMSGSFPTEACEVRSSMNSFIEIK
jgi:predicted metal-dependent hydrolase